MHNLGLLLHESKDSFFFKKKEQHEITKEQNKRNRAKMEKDIQKKEKFRPFWERTPILVQLLHPKRS